VRIFSMRVREEGVVDIPHATPPSRPRNRALPLRGQRMLKEQILARSTFFEHFDGAIVDWRYMYARDMAAVEREAGWLQRQGVRLWVDFTSGINLYPDLRLVNNDEGPFNASMAAIEDVLAKMNVWGARDAILCLHRVPENNISREDTWASFELTLRTVCEQAAARGIAVYLRASTKDGAALQDLARFVGRIAAPNLKLAPSVALLLHERVAPEEAGKILEGRVGAWLVSAPGYDVAGDLWSTNATIAGYEGDGLGKLLAIAPDAPVLLDAVYANLDEEYFDARAMGEIEAR
jgi:hypothetical protein